MACVDTAVHQTSGWLLLPMLYRFAHDQEPLEICEVLFAWDEKRGGDVVFAAGWNAKVSLVAHVQVHCDG